MPEKELSLKMERDWNTLAECLDKVREFGGAHALSGRTSYVLELVLEEILSNAVRHVPAGERRGVEVTVSVRGAGVRVRFDDRGVAFDPTAEAERREGLAGDECGGFGLHLVKGFVDHWEYARVQGANQLTLTIGG